MSRRLREIAEPFVAAAPAGARVRTRLRVSPRDAEVLRGTGRHLGMLAGRDLAARCAEGRLDARGRAESRRERKQALTAASSSRWSGAITRTSEDAWQLASRNLAAERATLKARVRKIEARTAVPAGKKHGRTAGYATPAERHAKTLRLKALKGRLARVERRIEDGAVSVARGGRRLMRARLNLAEAGLTEDQWRERWDSARLFLTADGEKDKAWGNETLRWNPDEGWFEVKLPAPLAHLANRPHGRYRLSFEVRFEHRGNEVAAQAATGAVRYDISCDPVRGRWYIDASWRTPARPAPSLDELRASPVIAVDVNAGHLAAAVAAPDGNVLGEPFTIPLELAGLPATARDGRIRAAVTKLTATAKTAGARAVVIENLDFKEARAEGRERTGNRPSHGKRGRGFRRLIAGIPTARTDHGPAADRRHRQPASRRNPVACPRTPRAGGGQPDHGRADQAAQGLPRRDQGRSPRRRRAHPDDHSAPAPGRHLPARSRADAHRRGRRADKLVVLGRATADAASCDNPHLT